ncbi:MAG: DegT/DnrJ/EryC1/StrS family aminotransferase [Oscillospiraceae bacterium]|jgi:dTDP-4-amino-4,6-dideoxygalactose transaminase|nr:DegT/DnrJ/EryC1/StrS family aminotransferase [Oscillospiraceae bacterium]
MKDKHNIHFSPPDITQEEIDEVSDTLRSGWVTTGPKTKFFENKIAKFCGTKKTVCLNSATACMELTLRLLGIGSGDEVITCAYTYTASCSVILHVGATPVLIDTAPNNFEMDYEKLYSAVNEKTKAIIPIDLAGVICNYDKIFDIVYKKRGIFTPNNDIQKAIGRVVVLADSAHAFGASKNGVMCGNIADFTSFSFHAVKNLTTAEGGAVTWKDIDGLSNEDIYRQYMLLSLHGQSKDALEKSKLGSWEYDIVSPAYKCNMTDIMASIGIVQLKRYKDLLKRRKEIVNMYDVGLKSENIQILKHNNESKESSNHLYMVRLSGKDESYRNEFIRALANQGIPANVHYKPLPMFTAYKNLGFSIKKFPNAYNMYKNEITLPLHTLLSDEDVNYIIDRFKYFL